MTWSKPAAKSASPDSRHTGRKFFELPTTLLLLFGLMISMVGYPTAIWRDGWFYLSNGKSIFSEQMDLYYYWVREPGYPLLIRLLTTLFGNQDFMLVCLQSAMMTIALILVMRFAGHEISSTKTKIGYLAVFTSILTPQFFGYSSTILKQPLLVFLTALTVANVRLIQKRRKKQLLSWSLSMTAVFLASFISISLAYTWVIVPLLASAYATWPKFKNIGQFEFFKHLIKCVLAVAITLFLALQMIDLGRTTLRSYEIRVTGVVSEKSRLQSTNSSAAVRQLLSSPLSEGEEILQNVRSLTMLGPTDNFEGTKENNVFSSAQLEKRWLCGLFDDYDPDPWTSRFIEFGRYLNTSCRSELVQDFLRLVHPTTYRLYQVAMLSLLVYPVILLCRRRLDDLVLMIPAYWFLGTFAAGVRYTNDRYGLVLFPFAMYALTEILLVCWKVLAKYRRA